MAQINGVHELEIVNTKVFVVEGEKNILIDTASAPMPDEVLDFLEQGGYAFTSEQKRVMKEGAYRTIVQYLSDKHLRVDAIVCTHCHSDHIGNLKRLKESLEVTVAMHPSDIPVVEGKEELPAPSFMPPEFLKHFRSEPCKVDRALADGEFVTPDLQVIHVEGHTKGSICLLLKDRILIAGDCVVGKNDMNPAMAPNELNPPIEMFSRDYEQAVKSLNRLLTYNFSAILPSHGTSIMEGGKEKLEKMLREVAKQ